MIAATQALPGRGEEFCMDIPFRADQVGSLLRPPALAALRRRFKRSEIGADALRAAEGHAITEAVRRQEDIGLQGTSGWSRSLGRSGAAEDPASAAPRGCGPRAVVPGRPDLATGDLGLLPFTPEPIDQQSAARPLALQFWRRIAVHDGVSSEWRVLAQAMAWRIDPA
jgi:hypothetical protein